MVFRIFNIVPQSDSEGSDTNPSEDNFEIKEIMKVVPNEFHNEISLTPDYSHITKIKENFSLRTILRPSHINLRSYPKNSDESEKDQKKGLFRYTEGSHNFIPDDLYYLSAFHIGRIRTRILL